MRNRAVFCLFILLSVSVSGDGINFLYMAQSGYQPPDILEQAAEFSRMTGTEVHVFFPEYEQRYDRIVSSFAGGNPVYDVVLIDLIWVMDFIRKGYLDPLPAGLERKIEEGIIPRIYSAFSYRDKLWAVPFLADFQMLYINTGLMRKAGYTDPPATLEKFVEIAESAKKKGLLKYPLFDSWSRQEALVCEFTWLTGAFGGTLTGRDGRIDLLTDASGNALRFMVSLLEKGLMNPYSLKADEMVSAEVFLAGDSMFTTNWTFMSDLIKKSGQPVKDSWMPALLPVAESTLDKTGRKTVSISGYEGLGVLSVSSHKKSAWDFIEFLSRPGFQKKHLDYMSVWKSVWNDRSTLENDPFIELKEKQIKAVVSRPAAPDYKRLSSIMQRWIYKALLLDISPEEALKGAQRDIDAAGGGK